MDKIKVIIDTDPGIDDLLALAIAMSNPNFDIIAISTVFGNVSLEDTTQNLELICDIFNKKIDIIKGSSKPIFYGRKGDSSVHGTDGLGDLRKKYRRLFKQENFAKMGIFRLYEKIMQSNDKVTLIAIGPLTNIAKLLLIDEEIKEKIKEIHIMGGANKQGNVNEFAEFNFYCDSYSASIVLDSGIPIIISTLESTHNVYIKEHELKQIEEDSMKKKFIKESISFYTSNVAPLHDVVSIMTLSHPHLFMFEKISMKVITGRNITDGMSYFLNTVDSNSKIKLAKTDQRKQIIKYIISTVNDLD